MRCTVILEAFARWMPLSDSTHVSQNFIFFKSKKRKHGASESEEDN